ncbi:IclR family transcriptional regulator [Granulosicoccus antarcticus]|uniref:HTH-type transcriptional repressor AllR n=1 Tax=Granulosicoccus antarcticus IMCC3135 TaxID=1192854 RepID=A0A2Z2NRK0_9GAMM|nr:IclR family transcriptional regulator [Granulosicoccus antarcticus]ASJ74082.1 Acetate operon repressor [Granulosicoccus antarcticus IMCC3135]
MKLTESSNQSRGSSSAERTLRLLQYVAERSQSVPLAELSTALDLPKPTAHRMCQMLLELGMLANDVNEKAFLIGPALRRLALDTLTHGTLSALRHTVLDDLVDEVGETCNFTTLSGSSVLYLDRVETRHAWRLTINVGERVPIHCTASGKLFLAFMSSTKRNYLLRNIELRKLTDMTETDPAKLRTMLDAIASDGYSEDRQEFITGLVAIAVPVFDTNNELRAAVAMHAPISRVSSSDALDMLPALKKAAQRLTALL